MQRIIVVPTREEQVRIEAGQAPDISNIYVREFVTPDEADAYVEGLEALPDLMEYEVTLDEDLAVTIDFGGDVSRIAFQSRPEKEAYLSGLDDADGFMSPVCFREGDEEFEFLRNLLEASGPRP